MCPKFHKIVFMRVSIQIYAKIISWDNAVNEIYELTIFINNLLVI